MNNVTTDLYLEMNKSLEQIAASGENLLQRTEQSYQAVQQILEKIKEYILKHKFESDADEIYFFRKIKPMFLKELIFYRELFHIEANKPLADYETVAEYYRKCTAGINTFFERNKLMVTYYRLGNTMFDEIFFLRSNIKPMPLLEAVPGIDTRWCTVASYKFGKIQALEELGNHLLKVLHTGTFTENTFQGERPDTTWTDAKAQLIEIGYSLFSKGSINNGKADIKLIMAALEQAFNVNLGNYYAVFNQNIRLRKKNRTVFLNQLENSLNTYMENLDQYPRDYPIN